nr:SH3 domain-containing protein [Rhizobium terrae]
MSLAAVCALFAAPSLAEAAVRGIATANVNMRSGPSTGYPAVVVIPAGAPVTIYGCMSSVNWCDVAFAGGRGWVSGNYVQATYRSNRVYVEPDHYRGLGIPSITFDVDNYWGRYYRGRDFYRERDRWRRYDWRSERPLPPPPPPRWDDRGPPRWDDRGPPRWDRDRDRDRWDPRDRQPPPPPVWQGDRDRDNWDRNRDRDRDRGNWDRNRDRNDNRPPPPPPPRVDPPRTPDGAPPPPPPPQVERPQPPAGADPRCPNGGPCNPWMGRE